MTDSSLGLVVFIIAVVLTVIANIMQWRYFRRFGESANTQESRRSAVCVLMSMLLMCASNAWFGALLVARTETPEGFILLLLHFVVLIGSFLISASLGVRSHQAPR